MRDEIAEKDEQIRSLNNWIVALIGTLELNALESAYGDIIYVPLSQGVMRGLTIALFAAWS
jgi:hypothetical protein